MPMTTAPETTMPPTPETEQQLLSLLDRHLRSTEETIAKLERRLNEVVSRMDSSITRVEARLDSLATTFDRAMASQEESAKRNFWTNIVLIVVIASMGGANLYVQASRDGATVATGTAVQVSP